MFYRIMCVLSNSFIITVCSLLPVLQVAAEMSHLSVDEATPDAVASTNNKEAGKLIAAPPFVTDVAPRHLSNTAAWSSQDKQLEFAYCFCEQRNQSGSSGALITLFLHN